MFVGYQKDKIVLVADNREALVNNRFIFFDRIEETDIKYELHNGEYLTPEELAIKQREEYKRLLIETLDSLDLKCIRSLRALQAGTGTEEDSVKLAEYEAQAANIRQQIQSL